MQSDMLVRRLVYTMLVTMLTISSAAAAITTRIDRPSVDLNESFQLEIKVDTSIDIQPDLSVLDENFYRGQVGHQTNASIINGQIRRSQTWTVALMAKSVGQIEIPAIPVGAEKSSPIVITVNKPADIAPGEADVFVTSDVDQTETFVQAQILYRIKVYRAVATRQPSLRDPVVSGVEALVELVGDERSYESILNDRPYNVVERVIAIYPQESGEIAISPARFEARVLRDGRITGRKVFESDAHTVKVLPIPAPPDGFPDAAWLPARNVLLSEEWSREPNEIKAGEPITRHVTISALGQIETQLPALPPPVVEGMNVYGDKPDLSRAVEVQGIRGIRKDQYAMIGVRGGAAEIPEISVPWWDLEAGEWRVARLPAHTLEIEGPVPAADLTVPVGPDVAPDEQPDPAAFPIGDGFWKSASQLLAAIWLLTVLAWYWSSRQVTQEAKAPTPPPVYKQQAKFLKAARKAARASDKAGVRVAMIGWGRLQWPADSPRSVGNIADRVAAPLSGELSDLSALSYGQAAGDWDGQSLFKALRSIVVLNEDAATGSNDLLPPLMPPGI